MKWQAVPSIINGGLHRMLEMNDDDKVMKITVNGMMMMQKDDGKVMSMMMDEMASCAQPYQWWLAQNTSLIDSGQNDEDR